MLTDIPQLNRFLEYLLCHQVFGSSTRCFHTTIDGGKLPVFVNQFWTTKQRVAHSLHEISYRACFKPQLPRFFIEHLTQPSDLVHDPFMGRGTTILEASLMGRKASGSDINPLCKNLCLPRLTPPSLDDVSRRLDSVPFSTHAHHDPDLLAFFHPDTLDQLLSLRQYFYQRESSGEFDSLDSWIRMVATNRLTGHGAGTFSVYTLPPNQATTADDQRRINAKRQQEPPYKEVKPRIIKKTKALLKDLTNKEMTLLSSAASPPLFTAPAHHASEVADQSVQLVVTSPPFLDVIDYRKDNWLRCWFNNIDASSLPTTHFSSPTAWAKEMICVFRELTRILASDGIIAFEVGEVRRGSIDLVDLVIPAAKASGLTPHAIIINDASFTKTANCWGINNNQLGTNTNRIVLLTH